MKEIEFKFICNGLDENLFIYDYGHISKDLFANQVIDELSKELIEKIDNVKHGYINKSKDIISSSYRENYTPITYMEV